MADRRDQFGFPWMYLQLLQIVSSHQQPTITTDACFAHKKQKHTTAGIRWWSPTQLLTGRRVASTRSVVGWVPPG